MKMNYVPQPIDTSDVVLPQELDALAELIAKNVHEVWLAGVSPMDGLMAKCAMMRKD